MTRLPAALAASAALLLAIAGCSAAPSSPTVAKSSPAAGADGTLDTSMPTADPMPSWEAALDPAGQAFVAELQQLGDVPGTFQESAVQWAQKYCAAIPKSANAGATVKAIEVHGYTGGWDGAQQIGIETAATDNLCPTAHFKVPKITEGRGTEPAFLKAVQPDLGLTSKQQQNAIRFGWEVCQYENGGFGDDSDSTAATNDASGDHTYGLTDDQMQALGAEADQSLCPNGESDPPPLHNYYTIKVFGNGSSAGDVTWMVDTDESQATQVGLPWSKHVDSSATYFSVLAQDNDGTSITCEVLDDNDHVLKKNTATGPYAIAQCSTGSL